MKNKKRFKIGNIFILKAGEEVFSIALQQMITFKNDVYVKITNKVIGNDDYVYGNIQIRFLNIQLTLVTDKEMQSFDNTIHGDIGFNLSQLTELEINDI